MFYRLGSVIILPALVCFPEVLPTLATCAVVFQAAVPAAYFEAVVFQYMN